MRRRRVWVAVVCGWMAVVAGLAWWGVGHEPATVPEQQTLQDVLPTLQKAAGVVYAAAEGPGRAVELESLRVTGGCRITPVREGSEATRDVVVYVRTGEVLAGLEAIAAGLPDGYKVEVDTGRGDTTYALYADAGNFVAIDADADAASPSLTLRVSSGCRPVGSGPIDRTDPTPGPAPNALNAALTALSANSGNPTVNAVKCPNGRTAGTYTIADVDAPADLDGRLGGVMSGASVVRSEGDEWAYRTGTDSVVISGDGDHARVSASTAC